MPAALARIAPNVTELGPALAALDAGADRLQERALSAATRRAYAEGWRAFERFCARAALEPLPATPDTIRRFVALLVAGGRAPNTVALRVAAIAHAHRTRGLQDPTRDPAVRATMAGMRRDAADRGVTIRKAPGVDVDGLRRIVRVLEGNGRRAVMRRALILTLWHSAMRRGELAALQLGDVTRVEGGVEIRIARSKADQEGQGATLAIPRAADPRLCAGRALEAWIAIRGDAPGSLFGVAGAQVNRIVRRVSRLAGCPTSAHGTRRGWITAAVRSGRRVDEVRAHSRHASLSAFSEYVELGDRWRDPIRLV